MNFLGCANCHQRDFVLIGDKTMVNEDEEEIVTYLRESRHLITCKYSVERLKLTSSVFAFQICARTVIM